MDWRITLRLSRMPPPTRRLKFSPARFARYSKDLAQAVDAMRIRITEPVFFYGKDRQPGEVMDVTVGPYRTQLRSGVPGGMERIPQFVEMPEEITQTPVQQATANGTAPPMAPIAVQLSPMTSGPQPPPAPGTFGEALASITKPVAPAPAKGNPLASRVRALTARRAKFHDQAAALLALGESAMATIETDGPAILHKSVQSSQDELAAITDLGDSLKEMDRLNSVPN